MRGILIATLLLVGAGSGNDLLRRAQDAYAAGNYAQSLTLYRQVQQQYPATGPQLAYNLAQCYRQLDSLDLALYAYQRAMRPEQPETGSLAANEAGILLADRGQLKEALATFRQALVFNPANEAARFNYELLHQRLFPPQDEPPPPPQAEPPPPEQPEGDPPPLEDEVLQQLIERLEQQAQTRSTGSDAARPAGADTLSPAEARRALERLRQAELQYLQQLRKRVVNAPRNPRYREW